MLFHFLSLLSRRHLLWIGWRTWLMNLQLDLLILSKRTEPLFWAFLAPIILFCPFEDVKPLSQQPISITGAFETFPCWNGGKVYWTLAFLRFYFALSRSGYSHPLLIKLGSHFQTLPATTSRVLTKQTANYSLSLYFLLSIPSQIHKVNILIQVSTSRCLPCHAFPGNYAFEPFLKRFYVVMCSLGSEGVIASPREVDSRLDVAFYWVHSDRVLLFVLCSIEFTFIGGCCALCEGKLGVPGGTWGEAWQGQAPVACTANIQLLNFENMLNTQRPSCLNCVPNCLSFLL